MFKSSAHIKGGDCVLSHELFQHFINRVGVSAFADQSVSQQYEAPADEPVFVL